MSILGVIAIHTFGAVAANHDLNWSASQITALVLSAGFIWAVPVFVMLSGALSLREESHAEGPSRFYARRGARIIPALIAWNFIYLVLVRMLLLQQHIPRGQVLEEIFDARVYPHLYFLWLIAGLYLIAPVLAAFLHRGGVRRSVIMAAVVLGFTLLVFMAPGVLGLVDISRPIRLSALTFWLAYVGYFLSGYALGRVTATTRRLVAAGSGFVIFTLLALAEAAWAEPLAVLRALASPEYLGVAVAALSVCVFILGVTLFDRIPIGPRLAKGVILISEASFGVFLIHLLVLLVPYALLSGFQDNTSLLQAGLAYVFIVVVSFVVSILTRRVPGLRRLFRRLGASGPL